MAIYEIYGGTPLMGNVTISGAKNAAVAILPATLLVKGRCRIENVPDISDVRILLSILESMGAEVVREDGGVVTIDCTNIREEEPDPTLSEKCGPATISWALCWVASVAAMWPCPAAAASLPVPSTSTSRVSRPWALP